MIQLTIHNDDYFRIGESHVVCQDYTLSSPDDAPLPFVLLSDGCSSGRDTDIGARILVRKMAIAIKKNCLKYMVPLVASKEIIESLNLCESSLYATLLRIDYRPLAKDMDILYKMSGDGFLVSRERKTGILTVLKLEFPNGYPYYLAYELDPRDKMIWLDNVHHTKQETIVKIYPDGKHEVIEDRKETSISGNYTEDNGVFDSKKIDLVAIFSDGIDSFFKLEQSALPYGTTSKKDISYIEVIKELFKFTKHMTGAFVGRRCNKFFNTFCKKNGWHHYDDFSMAAMYFEEEEVENKDEPINNET